MSDQPSNIEDQHLQIEDPDDVFAKLRQRIDSMRSKGLSKTDPQALAGRLAQRAKLLRGRIGEGEPSGPQMSFLSISHGPQRYGIPIPDIIEVQPIIEYTPVPGAPQFIPGVIQWRGSVVSLIDLAKLFEIAKSGLIDEKVVVIIEAAGRRVGIMAGEVEELSTVTLDQVKAAPELPGGVPTEWVVGVHDENRLILKIDRLLQDPKLVDWK